MKGFGRGDHDGTDSYSTNAFYAFIVLAAVVVVVFVLVNLGQFFSWLGTLAGVLSPFLYGFIIAYLCDPVLRFFHERVFAFVERKKPRRKLRYNLSVAAAYIILILFVTLFFVLVIPQVGKSYNDLMSKVDGYVAAAQSWADNFVRTSPLFGGAYNNFAEFLDVNAIAQQFRDAISDSYNLISKAANYIVSYGGKVVVEVKNVFLGIVISVYLLLSKKKLLAQCKKFAASVFSPANCDRLASTTRFVNETFGGFVVGKLLDSLIVGLITFIILAVFSMPYYPLIAVIIGVTNVIPFFGPFIGAIPSAFIIFIADPPKAIWFVIIIVAIQQLDGNVIGPKILGDSTGLSALWVVVAITVIGGWFGIPGMFLGVPIFAVLYAFVKKTAEARLAKRGLPTETDAYRSNGGANGGVASDGEKTSKNGAPDDGEPDDNPSPNGAPDDGEPDDNPSANGTPDGGKTDNNNPADGASDGGTPDKDASGDIAGGARDGDK